VTKPIAVRSFFDTNLLIYADAGDEPDKQERALASIKEHRLAGTGVVSTQVLQEYANVALRKLRLPSPLIMARLDFYARFEVVATTPSLIAGAIELHALRGVQFYDGLILLAAIAIGCSLLLSEDLQDGAVFSGVKIVNPFRPGAA
jgi:predicted nucleic acid-binding protein